MSEGLTVAELDMEQATYLPPREVMWGCRSRRSAPTSTVTNIGSFDGNGDGNTSQERPHQRVRAEREPRR